MPHRRSLARAACATLVTLAVYACSAHSTPAPAAVAAAPAVAPAAIAPWDTAAPTRDRLVQDVLRSIVGREGNAAESVFKNIQMPALKRVPARQLLQIMNLGYSRSLGVSCSHCHVAGDYASDEKKPKSAARGMIRFANQLPAQIRAIDGVNQQAIVNCTTCHRGSLVPALNLPAAAPR